MKHIHIIMSLILATLMLASVFAVMSNSPMSVSGQASGSPAPFNVNTGAAAGLAPGSMMHANEAHTGVYDDGGVQPNNGLKWSKTGTYGSPAVANGVIYVGGLNSVEALNAQTGATIWSFTYPSGYFDTPAVINGVVYVASSSYGSDGNVYALNAETGVPLWSFTDTNVVGFSSPTVANGIVYVESEIGVLYALNAQTGAQLWKFTAIGAGEKAGGDDKTNSPAVANGVVYFAYESMATALKYNASIVYAVDAKTGSEIWKFYEAGKYYYTSPAVANGVVYIGSDYGGVYALSALSGAVLWDFTALLTHGGAVASTPAVANGVVYVGDASGGVYALNTNNGSVKWSFPTGDSVRSSPAVANGIVYVPTDHILGTSKVYALNAQTGATVWDFQTTGVGGYSDPAVYNGAVYVGGEGIYAIGKSTGDISWIVVVGVGAAAAVGIVVGASVLKGRSRAPATPKTLPILTEKEKEKEKEKLQYILWLSTDRITVESEKPGDFTVKVWKRVGTQPPQEAPEAEIRLTPPKGAGLIVNPSVGQGQMSVQVRIEGTVQPGEVPLKVTASAAGTTQEATVMVSIGGDYVMKFE